MADWSSLPTDLMNVISKSLFIPDLVRASFVCTSWSSCLGEEIRTKLPQPWIIKIPQNNNGASMFVYPNDQSMMCSCRFNLNGATQVSGFHKGCVYFNYEDELDDMNSIVEGHDPITGEIVFHKSIFNFNNEHIKVLSSGSCSKGIEMLLSDKLWICEKSESDWFEFTHLWYHEYDLVLTQVSDICVKDLLVDCNINFLVGSNNIISIFEDLQFPVVMAEMIHPQPTNVLKSYLLKSDDDIFMVSTYYEGIMVVRVFKLDKSSNVPSWSPIYTLEGKSFFCSDYNCFVMSDIEVSGSLVNHVYLLGGFGRNDMVIFSLVDGIVQVLSLDEPGTSFVSLWYLFK